MAVPEYNEKEREAAMKTLPNWSYDPQAKGIRRSYKFADFAEAFSFMTRIAILAEKADHHPSWFNIYNRVDILLTTHEANGLSQRDIDLAITIDTF
jgi:4a-hydroxytetrahydrobiopterin dehydratase